MRTDLHLATVAGYRLLEGDVLLRLRELPDECVQCVVTSPPYWGLRDYRVDGQIGLEATPDAFITKLVEVFREVRRVLRQDGTCWVNMGDSYAGSSKGQMGDGSHAAKHGEKQATSKGTLTGGLPVFGKSMRLKRGRGGWGDSHFMTGNLKPKDLAGIPWMLAFALRADGWWLRQDIIWAKPNPMPESVTNRCTKSHEYLFLLTRSSSYYYDAEAIKEIAVGGEPGNVTHKGTAAYESGDRHHRTKAGLVAYAGRIRKEYTQSQGGSGTSFRGHSGNFKEDGTPIGVPGKRNKRSVWSIAAEPFSGAHFATFPTRLVEPCILAGTSEYGCCSVCGAPWRRKVERALAFESGSGRSGDVPEGKYAESIQAVSGTYDIRMGPVVTTETVGWQPSCKCDAETKPCTVLDPFNGAGTTGLVALRLGRHYLGIELNPEYVVMSERRLLEDAPLLRQGVQR